MNKNLRVRDAYWQHWQHIHKELPTGWLLAWSASQRAGSGWFSLPHVGLPLDALDAVSLAIADAIEVEISRHG